MSKADKFFMSRNKASFFSRFVAPKKKDAPSEIEEKEAQVGDQRTEGMDAHVFSQPIGYVPQFPPPPKYIRVRSHAKKEKDFNRLFLAQELKGKTGVEIARNGGRRVKSGGLDCADPRKDCNAIWAMEFSSDGKHLASGGKDFVVRVWAVLSTKEDRRVHETEEDAGGQGGQNVRLNAPVFKKTTVQEYAGHTASVLDLSWSKVCRLPAETDVADTSRTISCCRPQWIRPYDYGISAGRNVYVVSSTATSSLPYNSTLGMTVSFSQDLWTQNFGYGVFQIKVLPIGIHYQTSSRRSPFLPMVKRQWPAA